MTHLHHHLMLATALAAGMIVAVPLAIGPVRADDNSAVFDAGFNPATGQINPGFDKQWPSSQPVSKIPTPAEARAAKMMRVSTQPSTGDTAQASGAIPNAAEVAPAAATTGAASPEPSAAASSAALSAADEPPPSGPIGSIGQTDPAKFSTRNDTLDHVPTMAMPMLLSDQDRQKIYQAVMADKSQPAADADTLAPASELTTNQAANDLHELPASVSDIAVAKGLKYVKAKNKVLLVRPSTRIVFEQITS